jgi:hypothetical protein
MVKLIIVIWHNTKIKPNIKYSSKCYIRYKEIILVQYVLYLVLLRCIKGIYSIK